MPYYYPKYLVEDINEPLSPTLLATFRKLRGLSLLPLMEGAFDGVALLDPGSWQAIYLNRCLREWIGGPSGEAVSSEFLHNFQVAPGETSALADTLKRVSNGQIATATLQAYMAPPGMPLTLTSLRICRMTIDGQPIVGVWVRQESASTNPQAPTDPECRDALTGLAERAFLMKRLATLLAERRPSHDSFAVLFIDLDNFKQVNDAHGHIVGDDVLRAVAQRLSDCVRDGDHVVRFGGDEFVVLVEHATVDSEVQPIIGRIHAVLAKPISLPSGEFALSVSVGAAIASPEHQTPEDLLAAADRAMYAEKRQNG